MPQLHLYVPADVADEVATRAAARGLSVSKYLATLVKNEVRTGWPLGFFDDVVGKWSGPPLARPDQLPLEERDQL